ncbi:hypothetical protein F0562_008276 [Nyssa sinensis]|uniref:Dirigent protein n=1 Tax=Nyssa sinensis TaxID=561372 RepID=A0A5J5AB08_9ASTE|nr:hypothetical protein F0562_008276 [Nyssa sinensis]
MTLYLQDRSTGPNATVVPITGIPGQLWSSSNFGTVLCSDNPITEGLDEHSAQIGRAPVISDDPITESIDKNSAEIARGQGIYVTSSLDGANTLVLLSIVFTNREYNGSTLEIQGRSIQLASVREVSVISGTGKFRFARGYATFETVYLDTSIGYSVIRCNVTALHY